VTFAFGAPSVAVFAAAAVAVAVAVASLGRTSLRGGVTLTLMMFAVAAWGVASGLESAALGQAAKTWFAVATYAGNVNVAPLFFLFALRYRQGGRPLAAGLVALLWLIPVVTLVAAATNHLNGLVWSRIYPDPDLANRLVYVQGPLYWIAVAYYAILGVASAVLIARAAPRGRTFVGQTVILLSGLAIPWLATALGFLPLNPLRGVDMTPAAFAVTGVLLFIGMGRFRLLDLVPVARHHVVERMSDGLIVLDADGRLLDINPAARALFDQPPAAVGSLPHLQDGPMGRALSALRTRADGRLEFTVSGPRVRWLDLRSSELRNRRGRLDARLIVVQDISARRQMELEKERLIGELQAALGEVKTLSGLLPICSSCKRIRDDRGDWRSLERYLADHSDARFTHSLCDDCLRRLYPELASPEGPSPT